jgi:hypothetical protein
MAPKNNISKASVDVKDKDRKPAAKLSDGPPFDSDAKKLKRQDEDIFESKEIELQKARAIALWGRICQESKEAGHKKPNAAADKKKHVIAVDMEKSVLRDLGQGFVQPIFHALAMGEKSLFHSHSETHKLSATPVGAGRSIDDKTVHKLPESGNYHDAFFNSVKGDSGLLQANEEILDRVGPGVTWAFSPDETQNVAELVNMKAKMIGEDIEETKLPESMFGMFSTTREVFMLEQPLLTRSLSRGVVSDCFGSSNFSQAWPSWDHLASASPGHYYMPCNRLYCIMAPVLCFFNREKRRPIFVCGWEILFMCGSQKIVRLLLTVYFLIVKKSWCCSTPWKPKMEAQTLP